MADVMAVSGLVVVLKPVVDVMAVLGLVVVVGGLMVKTGNYKNSRTYLSCF